MEGIWQQSFRFDATFPSLTLEQFAIAHFETWLNPNKQIFPIKVPKKFPLVPEVIYFLLAFVVFPSSACGFAPSIYAKVTWPQFTLKNLNRCEKLQTPGFCQIVRNYSSLPWKFFGLIRLQTNLTYFTEHACRGRWQHEFLATCKYNILNDLFKL